MKKVFLSIFLLIMTAGNLFASSLPVSYDLREHGVVPAVRDQDDWGTCWAFSTLAAAETNFLSRDLFNLISEDYSAWKSSGDVNFSVPHLVLSAYLAPRRASRFSVVNNETKKLVPFPTRAQAFRSPGHIEKVTAVLSNGFGYGPVPNAELSYELFISPDKIESVEVKSLDLYTNVARLTDAVYFSATSSDLLSSWIEDAKELIMTNGAIAVVYNHASDDRFLNPSTHAYYYSSASKSSVSTDTGPTSTNHLVAIIGWSDDVPVTAFSEIDRPSKPGAWLARNSWGKGGKMDSEGYFWISYEQKIFGGTAFIMEPADKNLYTYSYDDLGWCESWGSDDKTLTAQAANVFKVVNDGEVLDSIGFYTTDNGATAEISVYSYGDTHPAFRNESLDANLSADITGGTLLLKLPAEEIDYAGWHTFILSGDERKSLTKDNYFGVVIKFTNKSSPYPIAIERRANGYSDYAIAHDRESYFYVASGDSGLWRNGASMFTMSGDVKILKPANACIKVFTYCDGTIDRTKKPSVGQTIDNVVIVTEVKVTTSDDAFKSVNKSLTSDDYKGRRFSRSLVWNDGRVLSSDIPVGIIFTDVEELYEITIASSSVYGTGPRTVKTEALYEPGYEPNMYFEDEDEFIYPVYGPAWVKTGKEGRAHIEVDNLLFTEDMKTKLKIPAGHYEILYIYPASFDANNAPEVVGVFDGVYEVTASTGGSNKDDGGRCNTTLTGLAGLILISGLLFKKAGLPKK